MVPLLVLPPAQTAIAPAPLEVAALDFCRAVAGQMGWEAKPSRLHLKGMRSQAASLARAMPPNHRALPLLEAALGALESALGEEAKGEKRFGRAAKILALRWQSAQKAWGARDPRRLPALEDLALLYELGGMRASPWRDEALRIRVSACRAPDLGLEKDLAAAVEDHYGPWLTVVELEPMLEFSRHLARIWMGYRENRALTQRVLRLGLKPDAHRVWKLAARAATESQRLELADLLARLDPDTVLGEEAPAGSPEAVLGRAAALAGTPLEGPSRELLRRMEARLGEGNAGPRTELRRRILRALQDGRGWADLLSERLADAKSPEEISALLGEAEQFFGAHDDARLLEAGTQKLKGLVPRGESPGLAQRLESWAELQRAAGHPEAADELLRLRLGLEELKGGDGTARCELLGRLGRWKELEAFLGPAQDRESERVLGWRYRAALGRGDAPEANRWLEAWLARVTGPEAPGEPPLLPGLCWALPRIQARPEAAIPLAARYGARLLPGQEALLDREPWRILTALDPDAPASPLPAKVEEALRWRWNRLPRDESRPRLLERLVEEAEAQLGSSHVLVAELLMDLGDARKEEGLESLERARGILEGSQGHDALLAKAYLALAAACSLVDGKGLERNLLKAITVLERMPRLAEETEDWAREMPTLLLLHLWREQRLDELVALEPRIQSLAARAPKAGPDVTEMSAALATLTRVARFQSQLRAAGLP